MLQYEDFSALDSVPKYRVYTSTMSAPSTKNRDGGRVAKIPPASISGRVLKLITGAIQVWYAVECIRYFKVLAHPSLETSIWLFVLVALVLFPLAINLGFRRVLKLGRRPLWLALGLAALLAVWDWTQVGTPWGPTVAMGLLALTIYTHLHVGVSHLLSALSGVKGCEMRVIPYYLIRLRGGEEEAELCLCPAFWTPIDRWEAKLKGVSL